MKTYSKYFLVAIALILLGGLLFITLAIMDAQEKLAEEKRLLERKDNTLFPFTAAHQQRLDENRREGWQQLTHLEDTTAVVNHEGFLYLATGGGLLKFSLSLELLEHYTQLNGLLDVKLTSFCSDDGFLYVGSKKGISVVKEDNISSYPITIQDFTGVTALVKHEGQLLSGTRGAGIIALNSDGFALPFSDVPGADFKDVTCLYSWSSGLAVGTRDAGLFVMQGASFVNLTEDDGLASNHITSLAGEDDLLVSTSEGISSVDMHLNPKPWLKSSMASSILQKDSMVYVGTLDGKCTLYIGGKSRSSWSFGNKFQPAVTRALVETEGEIWALTSSGAYQLSPEGPVKLRIPEDSGLKGSYIASMVSSSGGRIWLGYFDQGIEVLDSSLRSDKYFDEPKLKTVKHLKYHPLEDAVYAGTSKGLAKIDRRYNSTFFNKNDGIINNEVNHIALMDSGELSLGTGGGLSLLENNGIKSIYAFHGLINNRVFTQLETEQESIGHPGRKLLAGTLGGISIIGGSKVLGSLTPENSPLPIHWITALEEVDDSIFIGTYGAGVSVINPDGSWAEMPDFMRKLEINPNAFFNNHEYFFAGTLDSGILILDKSQSRWLLLRDGLGSLNITAFADDESRFYIGSDAGVTIVNKGSLVK